MKLTSPEKLADPVYLVACPTCGEQAGWTCRTRGFGGDRTAHVARIEAALARVEANLAKVRAAKDAAKDSDE